MARVGFVHPRRGGEGITLLVLNQAAIQRMNLPGGMTYTWGRNIGREVAALAEGKLFPGHGYRTGDLRRSIGSSVVPSGGGVAISVRATAKHAIFYHEGTRPHVIAPNPPRRWLKFFWEREGRVVYRKQVFHPGFQGRPFLREAMNDVLILHGITL